MWAPINTFSILQNVKAEVWEKCSKCSKPFRLLTAIQGGVFREKKLLAHKLAVRKIKVFYTLKTATQTVVEKRTYISGN